MYKRVFKQRDSRVYRVRYRLSDGPRIYDVPLRTHLKEVAEIKARQLIEDEEKRIAGIGSPAIEREAAQQPIEKHVDEFVAHLKERQRNGDHVRHTGERLKRLCTDCRWTLIRDVSGAKFTLWRNERSELSAKTRNEYLAHGVALFNWLIRTGRASENPLKSVFRLAKAETFKRRALTLEEFERFMRGCEKRRTVYFLACCSGLRRGELKQLLWSDLVLEPGDSFIELRAATTKNKKGGRIPLLPVLAALLREEKAKGVHVSGRVLPRGIPSVKTLTKDLEACGITVEDERGYRVDFHALRHTFVSLLANAKVPELARMKLARHSSWKQTDGYTDPKSVPVNDGMALLAASLPSSLASPNSGKSSLNLGNVVQIEPSPTSGKVIQIADAHSTLAKAVPYWETTDWSGRGESNPRGQFGKLEFYH